MTTPRNIVIEATDLSKSFGQVQALKSVSIKISSNEYFVLLGPSGGGKTTLLRLIGGFVKPTSGEIRLHGEDVSDLPPNKRPTSMVFQSYALFPHMTVYRNVGYGLRLRKLANSEIQERVGRILDTVELTGYEDRMPWELSGGQQQRVQLARALVLEPEILLLDEPLAALDENLRKDMCYWLKHLQETVGITFVHVTHNQEEAMTVADRIAIIAAGELVECGSARDVYRAPKRKFTAGFMGESNIFEATVVEAREDVVALDLGFTKVYVQDMLQQPEPGAAVSFSVRSERMQLLPPGHAAADDFQTFPATYLEELYLGLTTRHMIKLPSGQEIAVRAVSELKVTARFSPGDEVLVGWRTEDGRLHLS